VCAYIYIHVSPHKHLIRAHICIGVCPSMHHCLPTYASLFALIWNSVCPHTCIMISDQCVSTYAPVCAHICISACQQMQPCVPTHAFVWAPVCAHPHTRMYGTAKHYWQLCSHILPCAAGACGPGRAAMTTGRSNPSHPASTGAPNR
jgi:hypothetical protein